MYNNNHNRYQQNGDQYFHHPHNYHNTSNQQQHLSYNNYVHPDIRHQFPFNTYDAASFYAGYSNSGGNYPPNPRQDWFMQPAMHQQRSWGKTNKRSHELVEISPTPSMSTMTRSQGETSPAPKRQLYKQNSVESPKVLCKGNKPNLPAGPSTSRQSKTRPESLVKLIQNVKEKEWNDLFSKVLKEVEKCKPGDEVNILLRRLQPSRTSWSRIKDEIHCDMMRAMSPLNVDELLVFGSTLTGLDFVGSDLDYYVRLKVQPSTPEEVKRTMTKATKLCRSYHNKEFKVIYIIQGARVPIIRLVHQNSRTTCDVNFTSQFGYYNSCFIGNILGYDNRIKDLAVILKLWSKSYKISERMIISNYCLVMLVIFYLQNLDRPMLDSIKNNQESFSPSIIDQKYRWNVFFNDRINLSRNNRLPTCKLLVGFFEFYHKLNFSKYILSLYNGELIPREEFQAHPDFEEYRKIVAESELPPLKFDNPQTFIVQDGFELNLNVGIKVNKNVDEFFEWIKVSYEKCLELKDKPFSTLLITLFTELKLPENVAENKNRSKAKKKFQMTIYSIAGDLKVCQDILSIQDKMKIFSVEDQQKFFFNRVYESAIKFLKEIYLCTIVPEEVDSKETMVKQFKIILHVDTINGRKKINFKDDAAVINEINLSKKMNEKKVRFDLDISMKISSKDKGKSVNIEMFDNDVQKKTSLFSFGNFFSVNIPQAVKFYLRKELDEAIKQPETKPESETTKS